MSKVRNLPELLSLADEDIIYAVESAVNPNGGRKSTIATLRSAILSPSAVKSVYESNTDTNAFTDAEKTKLAGIETGATADQNAEEVPYDNSVSGLSATQVQDAIDEVNVEAQADFRPSIVSGRILHYTGGTVRFDGIFYQLVPNDILLNQNVADGEVYVDLDGIVKQTGSGILAPPYTVVFAKFSTDLNNIISLTDERVKNSQNIVRGILADVRDVRAGAAAAEGTSGRVSDAMHKHNILTGAASTQTPDQTNAEGVSANLARADHTHQLVTDAPVTALSPAVSNAQGSASSFSRSDHTHSIATALVGDITTILPDDTASAGTANNYARGDHRHAIAADAPVDTGTANTEGNSTSFARSNHVHNTVISRNTATATADTTTISTTDGLISGMTITPSAGTYMAIFSSSVNNSGNGATRLFVSLYVGGTQIAHSEREIGISGGANVSVHTTAIFAANGAQDVEARWRAVAGTNTAHKRSLSLIRLG